MNISGSMGQVLLDDVLLDEDELDEELLQDEELLLRLRDVLEDSDGL